MRHYKLALAIVVLVALVVRAGAVWRLGGNLSDDRDAYLGIAQNLAEGHGFAASGSQQPTAYRPPLYPVALAAILRAGGGPAAIGVLHVLLGTATVLLTWCLGRRLGLERSAVFAAALVAVDPLLVLYTSFPMTETMFTFLVALLLFSATGRSTWAMISIGVLFGLAALCRPTIWMFGALAGGWWGWRQIRLAAGSRGEIGAEPQAALRRLARIAKPVSLVVLAAAATLSPWVVRNVAVFGRPIVTTTHGGYTLLLGNNPVFYHEVVDRPWGTVWEGDSLGAWQQAIEAEMQSDIPPPLTEIERDRWMYRRALGHIGENPGTFVRACWLRFRRFWNVMPLAGAGETVSPLVRWGVGAFYGSLTFAAVIGLLRLTRNEWRRWMPLVLLIVSFTLVHLVYWSNTRMRAPLIPAIALLAARGVASGRRKPAD